MSGVSRYHRQMMVPGVGAEGQARLAGSHAVVVGVGALGCASAEMLARAGVGTITVIDRDVVEVTNLQRQCLYAERDIDMPKAEAAARRLREINSEVEVRPVVADVSGGNVERLLGLGGTHASERREMIAPEARATQGRSTTVLVDGTDNFDARYLLNDVAVKHGVAFASAGVVGTRATRMTIVPEGVGAGPCLRCVFPDAPAPGTQETCDTAGVLGPAVAAVAAGQASDVLRIMLGLDASAGTLRAFDLWAVASETILHARRDHDCPCCGRRRFDYLEGVLGTRAVWLCGQNSVQIFPDRSRIGGDEDDEGVPVVDLAGLASRLAGHGAVTTTRFMTRATLAHERGDDGGPVHLSVFPDGRALVRGVRDPGRARAIYDRYVGA
jgi:adenylyltransferase/sulfurtransferase